MSGSSSRFSFSDHTNVDKLTAPDSLPPRLTQSEHYLVAVAYPDTDGTSIKRPVYPSLSKADTCSFQTAVEKMDELVDSNECPIPDVSQAQVTGYGLGLQLDGTPFFCLDGDDVWTSDEQLDTELAEILDTLELWSERSLTTGIHTFGVGSLPDTCSVKYPDVLERACADAEFYDGSKQGQFIFLTGNCLRDYPVVSRDERLQRVVRTLNERTSAAQPVKDCDTVSDDSKRAQTVSKSDEPDVSALRQTIDYWASERSNDSAKTTLRLWQGGSLSSDDSADDASFVMRLLYWSKGASNQSIKAYWEASNRPTGDDRHSKITGTTYSEYTIAQVRKEWDGATFSRPFIQGDW